jgi:Zn-dependent peptidase ImmA (M78 family)/DNA-binding XRE family transcriptional regulator
MINGYRIRQVRELCGWTQVELANKLGIKQPTLAQLETGSDAASRRVVEALAQLTDFKPEYFEKPDTGDFPLGSLLFRAHSTLTNKHRTEAYRHAQLLYEIWTTIAEFVNELPIRIPQVREDPVIAARLARAQFGLSPDQPISYVINTVERSGVTLLSVPVNLEKRDAFSLWTGSPGRRPVIAISGGRPGDRVYWSVAHELGHLVLHNPIQGSAQNLEEEADRFAAEFLLPEAAMHQELVPPLSLKRIAQLKLRWRVSMQAIIRRARELNIIPDRTYRYLFEQMAWRGWRVKEPSSVAIPMEKPRGLREMAELVYGKPVDFEKLSRATLIGIVRLRQIIDAHAGNADTSTRERADNGKIVVLSARSGKRIG